MLNSTHLLSEDMGRIPPMGVKRELRREVNFGCAICGAPLLEYHHIIPYSEVEHHDPDHMVALCPNHHRLSDDGAISRSELYEYKVEPSNSEVVEYDFYFDPDSPVIPLGSNIVEIGSFGRYRIIQVGDQPIISVYYTDHRIEFDVNFYDKSDELIAVITDNEWWANTEEFWDIKYQSNRLKLWNEKHEIGFESEYHPEDSMISFRGRFLYNGKEFIIYPKSIKFPGEGPKLYRVGIVVGAEKEYDPRISKMGYKCIKTGPETEGVFLVDDDGNASLFETFVTV